MQERADALTSSPRAAPRHLPLEEVGALARLCSLATGIAALAAAHATGWKHTTSARFAKGGSPYALDNLTTLCASCRRRVETSREEFSTPFNDDVPTIA